MQGLLFDGGESRKLFLRSFLRSLEPTARSESSICEEIPYNLPGFGIASSNTAQKHYEATNQMEIQPC
jgi:hypothetical protein